MADFLIETTNERGVVEQKRVSMNGTVLSLANRSLVRIAGVERATMLRQLHVSRPINRISGVESHAFSSFLVQLEDNCFVDVPACMLALTQLTFLNVGVLSSFCFFVVVADSAAALQEPLVVSARCH
jgi:hypothetical protein